MSSADIDYWSYKFEVVTGVQLMCCVFKEELKKKAEKSLLQLKPLIYSVYVGVQEMSWGKCSSPELDTLLFSRKGGVSKYNMMF